MVITFLVPMSPQPVGGVLAIYEFANALARLRHEVQLVHVDSGLGVVRAAEEITWCELDPRLRHQFAADSRAQRLPDADFLFGFGDDYPSRCGLPLLLVQGYGTLPRALEDRLFTGPYPKLCTTRWLVHVCRELGGTDLQVVHLPCGVNHQKYRVISRLKNRPLQVAMVYNAHFVKAAGHGLEALARVKRRIPEARIALFGVHPLDDVPTGMTFLRSPPQTTIVGEVYNSSRVFLNSSTREGFGLPCVEAMACGCALVTTDNGGSRDYALHGQTALVARPGDVTALAAHIEALLTDDARRLRLAQAGTRFVRRFDWDESGRRLESFLQAYAADPGRYQTAPPGWSRAELTGS